MSAAALQAQQRLGSEARAISRVLDLRPRLPKDAVFATGIHSKYRTLSLRAGHATMVSAISQQTPEELAETLATMSDMLSLINGYASNEVKTRAAAGYAFA